MKKQFTDKIVTGLIVGALTVGMTGSAFAASDTVSRIAPTWADGAMPVPGEGFGGGFRGGFGGDREEGMGQGPAMMWDSLVESGVIDQTTADKLTAFCTENQEDRQAEMEKIRSMTEAERQAFFEGNKDNERDDMFAKAVSAGVITQAQADAIKAAMPEQMEGFRGGMGEGHTMMLDSLVESGVIDQATADKLTAYFTSKQEERQTLMESMKSMTDAEKKAYFESNKDNKDTKRADMFAEAVSDGIITQAQADAIKAAMPEPKETGAAKS